MRCCLKLLPLVFILALFAPRLVSAGNGLDEGDFLAGQGLFDEAITSYLKYVFLHPDDPLASAAYRKISRAYTDLGDSSAALRYSALAIQKARGVPERRERALERAEILLAFGRYESALIELGLLDPLDLSGPERRRCWFLTGVADTYLGRWKTAGAVFRDYFALSGVYPPETRTRVLALLEFGARSVPLDPFAAEVLSYVLPGSGQIYAGDLLQGLNSLLVTGAAGALVAWAVVSGDYFDAAMAVVFIFTRFYTGGPYHAARIANERNENRKRMIQRAVFDLLAK
ncbi:MAG: hypothetical protein JXD23_16760 [Spirochaetales bacterium]|nr:hypothetical protein [Spirochaetales bacterium]